ncbi:class I SAM-dependent methyltransferase [Gottfriedia solisilvae]|uniref:SAM-dependent methyltransferase n=1 Tax=Gottfriedia solisilvae TaxID=1516104 RepID=A0A8J3F1N0_9BACI|nr:class I SAM-dependent methyltransferase [Gottfriedia solisilvae]GGI17557.1 SAM-dependent methyltransferase [Gottfriedia solisilvae]
MSINFHEEQNKLSYTTRLADQSWIDFIKNHIDVNGKMVVDIGCGGGIYSKALAMLGAKVTAVDFSEEMLKGATENCKGLENIAFLQGNAYHTNLASSSFDIILQRALIHHLKDLDACFKEANRLLKKNGLLIIQDRTPEDCLLPGDPNHIRGYFFEKYPKLESIESSRRYPSQKVIQALESNGFYITTEEKLWEARRHYQNFEQLSDDLRQRTGRSILHELTNDELSMLIQTIQSKLNHQTAIIEKDRWTIWIAIKK